MEHTDFSRRSFLKGASLAGLTAGILGAAELAAPRTAVAAESTEAASLNDYQKIFGEDTNYIPVKKGRVGSAQRLCRLRRQGIQGFRDQPHR